MPPSRPTRLHTPEDPATITFVGGPYDGQALSPLDIMKIASVISISTNRRARKFGYFPTAGNQQGIRFGRGSDPQSDTFHPYELVNTAEGPQYQHDPGGKRYLEALAEAGI